MKDYKQLFEVLKRYDGDICKKCTNYKECKGEKCKCYEKGDIGYIIGKKVNFNWTCEDFDFGTCGLLENTPCNGCFDNYLSGFELKGEE